MRIITLCAASLLLFACSAPKAEETLAEAQQPAAKATPESPVTQGPPVELVLAVIEGDSAGNIVEKVAVVYGGSNPGDPQLSGSFENGRLMEVLACDTTTNPPTCNPIEAAGEPTLEAEARAIVLDIYRRLAPQALEEARQNYNNDSENIGTVPGITNTT